MRKQTGQYETQHASKYLQQLCKHFRHKVNVTYDIQQGDVAFPFGKATLEATDEALVVVISGEDDNALTRGRMVIDSHLKRFAFREKFESMAWQPEPEAIFPAPDCRCQD